MWVSRIFSFFRRTRFCHLEKRTSKREVGSLTKLPRSPLFPAYRGLTRQVPNLKSPPGGTKIQDLLHPTISDLFYLTESVSSVILSSIGPSCDDFTRGDLRILS